MFPFRRSPFDPQEEDFRTPDFNPHAHGESQSPVTDAFEASLNSIPDDPQEASLAGSAEEMEERASRQQWIQGMVHAASQIGYGIAGADPRNIDPRAGEMFVGSAQMRAKAAQDALERYSQAKAGRVDEAATRASLAGQDANFRAGREDSAAQRAHQSAALAQDQAQFDAAQRQQRQMARGQGESGITPYQQAQLQLQKERLDIERQRAMGAGDGGAMNEVLRNPGMQQDVATLDELVGDPNQEPPGTGVLERVKDRFMPKAKGEDTIRMQQAAQGVARRLLNVENKGREPNPTQLKNFMEETGILSGDPEAVRLGYERLKAQLQAYEQMGAQVPGGEPQEQDDWQDYEPGQGGGMFR